MSYQSDIHCRRSIRLRGYDYSGEGAYFVTVCTCQRESLFGDVSDSEMRLNEYGRIVQQAWNDLPYHSRDVQLDQFVIMPNHVHGIVVLTVGAGISVGAQHAAPLQPLQNMSARPNVMPGSLGAVVRSFKSATTKHINQCRNTPGHPVWQRNYYDHIIRGDRELNTIRQYIVQNPACWTDDPYRC